MDTFFELMSSEVGIIIWGGILIFIFSLLLLPESRWQIIGYFLSIVFSIILVINDLWLTWAAWNILFAALTCPFLTVKYLNSPK